MKAYRKFVQLLKTLLSKTFIRLSPHKYYSVIDELPVWNWWKIHETGDLSYLLIVKRGLNKYEDAFLVKTWKGLNDQYLKAFGLGEQMEEIIEKERNLILMYEDKNVNGNRDVMTFIELAEIEIAQLKKKLMGNEKDFYQVKAKLEGIMKFTIDIKKCSVKEYYSYFKVLSDGHK